MNHMNQKNQSPFTNPQFLLAMGITFLFLWGWQAYLNKNYRQTGTTPQSQVATGSDSSHKESPTTGAAASSDLPATNVAPVAAQAVETQFFDYSDNVVSFQISSLGFGFSDFKIKNYKDKKNEPLGFTSAGLYYFSLLYKNQPIAFVIEDQSTDEAFKKYIGTAEIDGHTLTRELIYDVEKKFFSSKLSFSSDTATMLNQLEVVVQEKKLVSDRNSFFLPTFDFQDFIYTTDGKTKSARISTMKDGEGFSDTFNNVTLASVGTQYFTSALLNKSDLNPKILNKLESNIATVHIQYDLSTSKLTELNQIIYVGAKKTEILNSIDENLSEVLNYGIFGFISKILLAMLKAIQSVVGNWGVAIIILTLIVRTLLLPLNITSFRSAQAMQKIKPQMDEIRQRYKSDPMRMNQETMALMKKHNANPITGCVPMLFQIPIFFAFFAMISTSVELYQQPFYGWITDLSAHDKYFVLPILMGLTMFFQQKLTPTAMDPTQAKILAFMPILFTLFMLTLPSGLTLYNFISALFGVVQQYYMLNSNKGKKA